MPIMYNSTYKNTVTTNIYSKLRGAGNTDEIIHENGTF